MRGGQANCNWSNEAINGAASEQPESQVGHLTEEKNSTRVTQSQEKKK